MPPDARVPGSPQEWLVRARSNLIRARQPRPEVVFWEDLCFDAQQAVEKALKAVLLARGVSFPYVHDIAALLTVIEQQAVPLPLAVRLAAALTEYAVTSRNPGTTEPVTEEEYKDAMQTAEVEYAWAADLVPCARMSSE